MTMRGHVNLSQTYSLKNTLMASSQRRLYPGFIFCSPKSMTMALDFYFSKSSSLFNYSSVFSAPGSPTLGIMLCALILFFFSSLYSLILFSTSELALGIEIPTFSIMSTSMFAGSKSSMSSSCLCSSWIRISYLNFFFFSLKCSSNSFTTDLSLFKLSVKLKET
jgi:hypothetical protein